MDGEGPAPGVFALASFGWLIFLLVLTLADYLTRG